MHVPRYPVDRIGAHGVFPARAPSSFSGAACHRINIALHNTGSVCARLDPLPYPIGSFLLRNIGSFVVFKIECYLTIINYHMHHLLLISS